MSWFSGIIQKLAKTTPGVAIAYQQAQQRMAQQATQGAQPAVQPGRATLPLSGVVPQGPQPGEVNVATLPPAARQAWEKMGPSAQQMYKAYAWGSAQRPDLQMLSPDQWVRSGQPPAPERPLGPGEVIGPDGQRISKQWADLPQAEKDAYTAYRQTRGPDTDMGMHGLENWIRAGKPKSAADEDPLARMRAARPGDPNQAILEPGWGARPAVLPGRQEIALPQAPGGYGSQYGGLVGGQNPELDAILASQPQRPPGKTSGWEGMNYTPDDPAAFAKYQQDMQAWQTENGPKIDAFMRAQPRSPLSDLIRRTGSQGDPGGFLPHPTVPTVTPPEMRKWDGSAFDPAEDARYKAAMEQQAPPTPADYKPPPYYTANGGTRSPAADVYMNGGKPSETPQTATGGLFQGYGPLKTVAQPGGLGGGGGAGAPRHVALPAAAPQGGGLAAAAMRKLRAPDGSMQMVPQDHVDHYLRLGAAHAE